MTKTYEERKEYYKQRYIAKKEEILAKQSAYKETYPEKVKATKDKYRHKNIEKHYAYNNEWRANNKDRMAFLISKRRSKQLKATPAWANLEIIASFYKEAKRLTESTGVVHEVDHIVPLQGKQVSGFHVEYNLQIITKSENRKKSNRLLGNNI